MQIPSDLFELDVHAIEISKVYLNGLVSVKPITIRNNSSHSITVAVSSNLDNQIHFQYINENYTSLSLNIATNTVDAALTNNNRCASGLHNHGFSELFNLVGYVNEISLLPLETRSIFLCFQPTQPELLRHDDPDIPDEYSEIKGDLFFSSEFDGKSSMVQH
jgi:hypothetical protein